MSSLLSLNTIELPLVASMRDQADRFAQEQPNPVKASQVYLNTLAVLVVEQYLNCMEIPSQLSLSRAWNPIDRLCSNVADLYLTDKGRVECYPVQAGEQILQFDPDRDPDRVGYFWVALNLEAQTGHILGYLTATQVNPLLNQTISTTGLDVSQLNSLDEFPAYLTQQSLTSPMISTPMTPDPMIPAPEILEVNPAPTQPVWTKLSQWLDGNFAEGWQSVEAWIQPQRSTAFLLNSSDRMELKLPETSYLDQLQATLAQWLMASPDPQSTLAYRGAQTATIAYPELQASVFSDLATIIETTNDEPTRWRAAEMLWSMNPQHPLANSRRIRDLGLQLQGQRLGLMIAVLQAPDYSFSVLLRLYPLVPERSLPLNLKLEVCSVEGESFVSTHSRRFDNFIQLCFNAIEAEEFCVKITDSHKTLQEYFVI